MKINIQIEIWMMFQTCLFLVQKIINAFNANQMKNHTLYFYLSFKKLSVNDLVSFVKQNNLCYKCFSKDWSIKKCRSKIFSFCSKPHYQMIRFKRENKIIPVVECAAVTQCNSSVSRSHNPAVFYWFAGLMLAVLIIRLK